MRRGFLLIDLMLSMGIFALVFFLAIPSFELIRDYRYKQFLIGLQRISDTAVNLAILRRKILIIQMESTRLVLLEQNLSPQNDSYWDFDEVRGSSLLFPSDVQVTFLGMQKDGSRKNTDKIHVFPGGESDFVKVEVRRNLKIREYRFEKGAFKSLSLEEVIHP